MTREWRCQYCDMLLQPGCTVCSWCAFNPDKREQARQITEKHAQKR